MKIKQLVWDEYNNAPTPFEYDYEISHIRNQERFVVDLLNENACSITRLSGRYFDPQEAKQAAQEDFERRIREALEQ